MASLQVTLSDLEGHFCGSIPLCPSNSYPIYRSQTHY